MKESLLLAALTAAVASGCSELRPSRAQALANETAAKIQQMETAGRTAKDDFILQFGPPAKCAKLTGGEVCDWVTKYGAAKPPSSVVLVNPPAGNDFSEEPQDDPYARYRLLRVEFTDAGKYVSSKVETRY